MLDLIERGKELHELEEVLAYPDWKRSRYIAKVYEYRSSCDNTLATVLKKFADWCDYFKYMDGPPEIIGIDLDALK